MCFPENLQAQAGNLQAYKPRQETRLSSEGFSRGLLQAPWAKAFLLTLRRLTNISEDPDVAPRWHPSLSWQWPEGHQL